MEMRYFTGWGGDWFQFGLQQGASEKRGPLTLGVPDNGETYVLDTVKKRVMVFRPDGTIWQTFHTDTEQATGIAVTSDGYVFLDNFDENRSATVYGPDGSLVNELAQPADLLVSSIKATSARSYAPWKLINRAQLVTLIVRAADQRHIGVASWLPPEFHPTFGTFDATHGRDGHMESQRRRMNFGTCNSLAAS